MVRKVPAKGAKRKRIPLPFEKKSSDPGTWVFDHRVGICITVIAYLLFGIVFISSKIVISREINTSYIILDMPEPPEEEKKELTPEERQQLEEELQHVRNLESNENAQENIDPQKAREAMTADVAKVGEEVQERLRSSREAYERGVKEVQDIIDSRNKPSQSTGSADSNRDTKVAGSVTVSFNLPGRTAVDIPKPSYTCEGGGQVVISITVNRNGDVTAATIQSVSTQDECLRGRAVEFAMMARFNADADAPAAQKGSITYMFVPQ